MRTDLQALTNDDLIALSNKGTVGRAQRQLEEGAITADIDESVDGAVTVRWSDGYTCILPPGAPLINCPCTCGKLEICLHRVRSVLAYRAHAAAHSAQPVEVAAGTPWNPGDIPDEAFAAHFTKQKLAQLRKDFNAPGVYELVRGVKPFARLRTRSITVRFLVPGDPLHIKCNCAEPAPCSHVPLAIWAFRQLPGDAPSGLIETGAEGFATPADRIAELETALFDLLEIGLSGASALSVRRWHELEKGCRESELLWPAEIAAELVQEYTRYVEHDARFSAAAVAELAGELLIRCHALNRRTAAVPSLFVRGTSDDSATKAAKTGLIGLGCGVEVRRGLARLSAYFADEKSGDVLAIRREFVDPSGAQAEDPVPFCQLANSTVKELPMARLGAQRLLIDNAKRAANGTLETTRAKLAANLQKFEWGERLRAPILAENFAEARAYRQSQPPACLAPRRVGEALHVLAVSGIERAHFDVLSQTLRAVLLDSSGERALLTHPYTSRGAEGFEAFAARLSDASNTLRFVCGHVRAQTDGLSIAPVSAVFERNGELELVQPWIERNATASASTAAVAQSVTGRPALDPIADYPALIVASLGDLLLAGLQRADERTVAQWQQLAADGAGRGFVRLSGAVKTVADHLAYKLHALDWDWRVAAQAVLDLALLARFALEQ